MAAPEVKYSTPGSLPEDGRFLRSGDRCMFYLGLAVVVLALVVVAIVVPLALRHKPDTETDRVRRLMKEVPLVDGRPCSRPTPNHWAEVRVVFGRPYTIDRGSYVILQTQPGQVAISSSFIYAHFGKLTAP
ncbi:dipeptidase 1 (renal) [Branchiostoma belcheri]|nr:dipeptidase 1 (renal) [Branchiostoma belcheri]